MLRDKKERRRLLSKQTELYFNHCEGCKYISSTSYCNTKCPIGEEMMRIGRALSVSKEPSFKKIEVSKEEYLKLHKQGMTNKQIADHFGVSDQLIRNRRRDWGLSEKREKPYVKKIPDPTPDEIKALEDQGLTLQQVADRLYMSRAKLVALRRKYGMTDPKQIDRNRPEYDRLRAQGLPLKKIALAMGVHIETVMRWRKRWGLKGDD